MKYNNRRPGQMLVIAVFVLLIFAVLGVAVASLLSSESYSTTQNLYGIQALNVAEAGLRFTVVTSLEGDSNFNDNSDFGPVNFGPGSFSVHYAYKAQRTCSLEVTGTVKGVSRKVALSLRKTGGGGLQSLADQYAIYMGSGGNGFVIGNNGTINGDAFIQGSLNMGSGTEVTGDATATGTIVGGDVLGSEEIYAEQPADPPSLETTYYDQQIAIANTSPTYTGNRTFSGSLAPGNYYRKGNVTLDDLTLTGDTMIVTTGSVLVGNNSHIGDHLTIIAAGQINIGNNVTIGDGGLWFSKTNMVIGNSGEIADVTAGNGTSFICAGDITAGNTFTSSGLIYAGGSLTVGNSFEFSGLIIADRASIGNGANITLNPASMDFSAVPGVTGSTGEEGTLSINTGGWQEIY